MHSLCINYLVYLDFRNPFAGLEHSVIHSFIYSFTKHLLRACHALDTGETEQNKTYPASRPLEGSGVWTRRVRQWGHVQGTKGPPAQTRGLWMILRVLFAHRDRRCGWHVTARGGRKRKHPIRQRNPSNCIVFLRPHSQSLQGWAAHFSGVTGHGYCLYDLNSLL